MLQTVFETQGGTLQTVPSHFTEEETEAQRGEVLYLKSYSLTVEPGEGPRLKDTPTSLNPNTYEPHSPFKPVELN